MTEVEFLAFQKKLCLDDELRTSIKLIELGFGELQNLNHTQDFNHLPLQLLASGFERLMKCHICFGDKEKNGEFTNFTTLKNIGHDLIKLKKFIIENHFNKDYPILEQDYLFLSENDELNEVLDIISEFGKYARYYNLDVVSGKTNPSRNVELEFKNLINRSFTSSETDFQNFLSNDRTLSDEVKLKSISQLISLLEKFVCGISRQFTMGNLGILAQQNSTVLFNYISKFDNKLGVTDYRNKSTNFSNRKVNNKKRNIIDFLERKFKKKYISKKIYKEEFGEEWPFYADYAIIELRDKHWCIITLNGIDYALNGSSKSRYKLDTPIEGGVQIPNKTIGNLIQMTLQLKK